MRKTVRANLLTAIILSLVAPGLSSFQVKSARAQQRTRVPPDSTQDDSTKVVKLGEIVVEASAGPTVVPAFSQAHIELARISRRDAAVVADLARLIPAAHLQTNSRGETLVYLRNAGERQIAVFFDGALLNVPWDNRVDLSLIPATVVGGMTVAKGVPPIEYGMNVLGGAVNLTSRFAEGPWSETELVTRFGTQDRQELSFTHRARRGKLNFTGALSYATIDGVPVPAGADLSFSQPQDELRTNTDSRVTNLFANARYDFGAGTSAGVALIHVDARKGIAPEGHLDPAASRVRFWRYPDWRNSMVILNGQGLMGNTIWKGAAWATFFGQTIESYGSASYDAVEATQEDDDITFGARFTVARQLGLGTIKLALNALTSNHDQRDVTFNASGVPEPGVTFPQLEYQQRMLSTGIEYAFQAANLSVTLGTSFDAMFAPKTGDKPGHDPFTDYSLTAGVARQLPGGWFVRAGAGRKTRFPTMRELFGVALDRFVINPNLNPESSVLVELALGVAGERLSGEMVPFGTFTSNTIEQRNVLLDGETQTRRRRINAAGSRVLGIEWVGTARATDDLTIRAHLTIMDIVRRQGVETDPTRLSEKPNALGRANLVYHNLSGFSFDVETVYTGRAYSLNDQDEFVALSPSMLFNVRVSQEVEVGPSEIVELFARVNNITDTALVPQLGLPEAGRQFQGGIRVSF